MEAQSCKLMFAENLGSARTRAAPNPNALLWCADLPKEANYVPTLILGLAGWEQEEHAQSLEVAKDLAEHSLLLPFAR